MRKIICMLLAALTTTLLYSPLMAKGKPTAMLVKAEGAVMLKRRNWNNFHPVNVGTLLNRGDGLRLARDASAEVLCLGSHTVWTPPIGVGTAATQGCPPAEEKQQKIGAQFYRSSRGEKKEEPYIILPRNTAVSDPNPLLRWNKVDGARVYSWEVTDTSKPSKPVWGPISQIETETRYPKNAPALIPNVTHILQVLADTGAHSSTLGVGFFLVSRDEQQEIMKLRKDLASRLSGSILQLALAVYYSRYQLRSESLVVLEKLAGTIRSPSINLLHAGILLETQLSREAFLQYESASQLAKAMGDRGSEAEALAGLARASLGIPEIKLDVPIEFYNQAIGLCQELGDQEYANELRRELQNRLP